MFCIIPPSVFQFTIDYIPLLFLSVYVIYIRIVSEFSIYSLHFFTKIAYNKKSRKYGISAYK
ncbi:hypothetical protein TUM12151_20720 [Morganella morganii]|nr:hypothetical protein TUM12150_23330 [Morganella morganii]GIZ35086.1 hypothetical protein TUM12151_20720 [Morganella morganii]